MLFYNVSITCMQHTHACRHTHTHTHTGIEKLIEPLRTTIQSKAKANAVKQEFEKQDELKRSAMRAIAALLTTPDHGGQRCFISSVHKISVI